MKIRQKFIWGGVGVWFFFLIAIYLIFSVYMRGRFTELEEYQLKQDTLRVINALELENNYVGNMSSDWGHWTDAYSYVLGKNDGFPKNNMMASAYESLKVDMIVFFDTKNNILFGKMYDSERENELPIPKEVESFVKEKMTYGTDESSMDIKKGIRLTPYGIMVLAASKVTDSDVQKQPRGTVVMGRVINQGFIDSLQETTQVRLNISNRKEILSTKNYLKDYNSLLNSRGNIKIIPRDADEISALSLIRDDANEPIGLISTLKKRYIYNLGESTARNVLISLAIVGLIAGFLLYYFSQKIIVRRLERLKDELKKIAESEKIQSKVTVEFNDEISYVARQINSLFDVIYDSHNSLEQRVIERTENLKTTNEKLTMEMKERKKIENELLSHKEYLTKLAHYDTLTGLPNRVLLNEVLSKTLNDVRQGTDKCALLFVDLDRFKAINDAKGHEEGDLVLKTIASRLSDALPSDAMIARIGGDEFIVVAKNIDEKSQLDALSKKILDACELPIPSEFQAYYLSASIGISLSPDHGDTLEELQKNADIAMYKAKMMGPGNYIYFENSMNFDANSNIELEENLHIALEKKEFFLHYQPKYETRSGRLKGAEALIRWQSSSLGFVSPGQFIPHAEKTGLIISIGAWVLEEVCRTLSEWRQRGYAPLPISFNLSAVQFNRDDVVGILDGIVQKYQLPHDLLEIEITESAIINNTDKCMKKLENLRALGFKISIDDFGSGYTSLNHIKSFPLDFLKLDKCFIDGIPHSKEDMAIIESIVDLSKNLGISVVAEGIETVEQLRYLASIKCDIAQGYLLAKPMSRQDFEFELERNQKIFAHSVA